MTPDPQRLLEYAKGQRPAFIDFVRGLVEIESPSYAPAPQRAVFARLGAALEAVGYQTLLLPGWDTGGQLYARPRRRMRGRSIQLLLGHTDTVWPEGTLRAMPCRLDGDTLYGPGVFDMKAGLAMIVFALRALHTLGLTPAVTPLVFINSDEEIGSAASRGRIERLARVADRVLVLEPALGPSGQIKTARRGVGNFEVIITGRAAHAGLAPEEGHSAILEMSHVVQKLYALNDPATGIHVNVGTVTGGLRDNVVAPESRLTVDVRVPTREAARRIEARIRALTPTTPGTRLTIHGGIDRMPMERTPRNRALWQRCRALGQSLGLTLDEGPSGGASDGNFTSRYAATLDGLGAVGDGAHAAHEHVALTPTLDRCALLALLLLAPPA